MKEQTNPNSTPQVGVGAIIKQNGKILLGRRMNQPMSGSWQLPGGWVRFGESPVQAAQRQLNEFQGLKCGDCKFVTYTNNVFSKNVHTVSLYFMVDCLNEGHHGELNIKQQADWFWADWDDLPERLFLPLQLLRGSGFHPFAEKG